MVGIVQCIGFKGTLMSLHAEKFTSQWEIKTPVEILYELFDNPQFPHLKNLAFVHCSFPTSSKYFYGREGSSRYISREDFERDKPKVSMTGTYPHKITLEYNLGKSSYIKERS